MGKAVKAMILVSEQNDPKGELRRGLAKAFAEMQIVRVQTREEALKEIASVDILYAFSVTVSKQLVESAARLRWIQLLGSGIDEILSVTSSRPEVLITSGRGAQAEPVSEAVIAFMFALARDIPRLVDNQRQRRWARWSAKLLKGRNLLVVGVGAIAERLAAKCVSLGMRVVGLSSAPRPVEGFDRILPMDALPQIAPEADFVVVLTPLSAQTRSLIGPEVFAAMKRTAFFINVARGGVVDEEALADALLSGRIAGAALDVFSEEPLPSSSPLWSCPNTLISPHLAGLNDRYLQDLLPLIVENSRRFLDGRVEELQNRLER